MNVRQALTDLKGNDPLIRLNDVEVDPASVRAVLINEVVPEDPRQDFYGSSGELYLSTTLPLFQKAGLNVRSIRDILDLGIYITNAVKMPKTAYAVDPENMDQSLPWLEAELALFPNVKVILLMGDVAKKMYNRIARKTLQRNVIPSLATYKLRGTPFYHGDIRVMPSYIMTGGNILIEKSKMQMAAEDIAEMYRLIR
ncbi:MAG: uracil-DNA glycosylase [Clostridiales bacterium]|nr:uracil-DNA glycosylase [Clostridiales bacterium]